MARGETGEVPLREYLTAFVNENPEFLPARIAGGSGTNRGPEGGAGGEGDGEPRADPSGHERGRDATGARGDRARGVADAERDVGRSKEEGERMRSNYFN